MSRLLGGCTVLLVLSTLCLLLVLLLAVRTMAGENEALLPALRNEIDVNRPSATAASPLLDAQTQAQARDSKA